MMNPHQQTGLSDNIKIWVKGMWLNQTGTYQSQVSRPFETHVKADDVAALQRSTQDGSNIGIGSLQGVAGRILSPSATNEGEVNISNGWLERRFRFIMVVVEEEEFNNRTIERVLFGYTDGANPSYQDNLDPEMRVYFNSETLVARSWQPGPNGMVEQVRVLGSNQIVSPLDLSGNPTMPGANPRSSFLCRPEDVYHLAQTRSAIDQMETRRPGSITFGYDARASLGNRNGAYKYSHRSDTSSSRYLHKVLRGWEHAQHEQHSGYEMNDLPDNMSLGGNNSLYHDAQVLIANQDIFSNHFLARLNRETRYMQQGHVTYGELCRVFPETDMHTAFAMDNGRGTRPINMAADSAYWTGEDNIAVNVSMLAQTVPGIMMDNMIRSISFAATNGLGGPGDYIIDFHDENLRGVVDGLRLTDFVRRFEYRLVVDLLNVISFNNEVPFQISMASDLAGDSVIDIIYDGSQQYRFVAPTFTDSLFTPVVTSDPNRAMELSSDMTYLAEQLMPGQPDVNIVDHTGYPMQPNNAQPAPAPAAPVTPAPAGQPNNGGFNNGNIDTGLL